MKGIELTDLRSATFTEKSEEDKDRGPRNLQFGQYTDEETGESMGVLVFSLDEESRPSNSGKTDVLATAGSSCWLANGMGFKVNVLQTVPTEIRTKRVLKAKIDRMKKQLDNLEDE